MPIVTGERLWFTGLLLTSIAYFAGSYLAPWSGEGLWVTGSPMFPRTIGMVLIVTSALALVSTWSRRRTASDFGIDPDGGELDHVEAGHPWTVVAAMATVAGLVAIFATVGALTAIAVFAFVSFVTIGRLRWWLAGLAALVTAVSVHLIFVVWLGVRLPAGVLI